ncbi:hypothetical protein [Myxococcus sp. CA039A]|uniref:hypothetical protein n=1 Tax=Myxococcus sp. CA039A TaxID=2741737 RepID=UPI0020C745AA|nr:hypothetical protein [Myxococcus sp. CA039A]
MPARGEREDAEEGQAHARERGGAVGGAEQSVGEGRHSRGSAPMREKTGDAPGIKGREQQESGTERR